MLIADIKKQLSHFELCVNFEIKDEIVVLFGSSGSGKTTILNCIAGLTNPNSGEIILNGRKLFSNNQSLPVQKREIGYLFQDYALFPHMTVKRNIYYGIKKEERRQGSKVANSLVEALGIKHLLKKYPGKISGGEKQRVALARALATEPKLLLLDEPFSALDERTRQACHEELLELKKQWRIPTILVTHNLEEAKKLGDRILFIENGQFIKG